MQFFYYCQKYINLYFIKKIASIRADNFTPTSIIDLFNILIYIFKVLYYINNLKKNFHEYSIIVTSVILNS